MWMLSIVITPDHYIHFFEYLSVTSVYSFFRLVRKLSQAKAFTVTVDGRAALTDFFQTNYAVVKGRH